ncbi:MAG: hypothetical protein K5988_03260 [Lachnospiraceae bacterium]|nr:hypothetical protein [Lachnospiraceae bacterium]
MKMRITDKQTFIEGIIQYIQKDFPNNKIDELINESKEKGLSIDNKNIDKKDINTKLYARLLGYSDNSSISQLRYSNIDKDYFHKDEDEEKDKRKGKGDLKAKDLIVLSRIFGVSTDYILGLSEEKHPGNKEFSKYTGLTEEAIESLRQLNKYNPDNTNSSEEMLLCEANSDIYSQTKKSIDFINYALTNTLHEKYNNKEYDTTLFELLWDYIDSNNIDYLNAEDRYPLGDLILPVASDGFEGSKFEIHKMHKESLIYQLRRILDKFDKDKWREKHQIGKKI